jgi:hypothetical protein
MFVIEAKAELKEIKLKMDPDGDELHRTVVLKLLAQGVDAARLDTAVSEIDKYWTGDQPALQETYPIRIKHTICNVAVTLSDGGRSKPWELGACDICKVQITPKMDRICDVLMQVHTQDIQVAKGLLDVLHRWLKSEVKISMVERQLSLPEMEQSGG